MGRHADGESMTMDSAIYKQALALVRDGDYAHPGEEQAILRVFSPIQKCHDRLLLDVGCGLGGTAVYVQAHGWGKVIGVDCKPSMIAHANAHHPQVTFFVSDVLDLEQLIQDKQDKVDLIYLFNAFYAFPQQAQSLCSMRRVAHHTSELLIFDYVRHGDYHDFGRMRGLSPSIPYPINLQAISAQLSQAGWQLKGVQALDDDYRQWYSHFLHKLTLKRKQIETLVGVPGYQFIHEFYTHLYREIVRGRLGGAIVRACSSG